jgi:hypothetical protein
MKKMTAAGNARPKFLANFNNVNIEVVDLRFMLESGFNFIFTFPVFISDDLCPSASRPLSQRVVAAPEKGVAAQYAQSAVKYTANDAVL